MLSRVKERIVHQRLERVSPLSVPVMMQIGREPVFGEAQTEILADAAEELIREAMGEEFKLAAAAGTAIVAKLAAAGAARHG
jgi:ATP-dependent Lhr-like helicase